jgi:hypothetical protein
MTRLRTAGPGDARATLDPVAPEPSVRALSAARQRSRDCVYCGRPVGTQLHPGVGYAHPACWLDATLLTPAPRCISEDCTTDPVFRLSGVYYCGRHARAKLERARFSG